MNVNCCQTKESGAMCALRRMHTGERGVFDERALVSGQSCLTMEFLIPLSLGADGMRDRDQLCRDSPEDLLIALVVESVV